MFKKIVAALGVAGLALTLAGCVGVSGPSSPDKDDTLSPPKPDQNAEPSFAPEPTPEPAPVPEVSDNLAFGDAMTWEDGLSLSVSAPVEYTPGQYAYTGDLPHNVVFNVTVTNGTTANFEGYVYATMTSGGAPAEEIFDSENGLNGSPDGVILPGQTITYKIGFNVADPAQMVMQIAPGFDYEAAIFTNTGGVGS